MTSRSKTCRVALVGLSADPSGYGWLTNVHFPAIAANPAVDIVGVLGSSKASAEAAILRFSLPGTVRAYTSPEDLAADTNVDFVVVGSPCRTHRAVLLPCLRAGKGFFVEWPLAESYEAAREIAELARDKGVTALVGIQSRYAMVVQRVSEIVRSGAIGRVLATSVLGPSSTGGREPESASHAHSFLRDSGSTVVDIHLAHLLECLATVTGRMKSVKSTVKTTRTVTELLDEKTGKIVDDSFQRSAPDQVVVSGETEKGIVLNIHLYGGVSPGSARWLIIGETGEIDVTGVLMLPWIKLPFPWTVKVHTAEGVEEEHVQEETEEGQPAVGRMWKDFFEGRQSWPSVEEGIRLHEITNAVWKSEAEGRTIGL